MKNKMGKIVVPALILSLLVCAIVFWSYVVPTYARPVSGTISAKLGSYTGAGSGQAHNIKASLDLAHTDLDVMLEDFEDVLAFSDLGTGPVWYVDSGASGDDDGTTWEHAAETIDDAVDLCTADLGDIILVAAGHVEDLGTTDPDFDDAGITIIGLGKGEQRPVLSFDASTDIFTVDADDIAIYNLVFFAHTPDVAKGIDITAGSENTIIKGCSFMVETEGTDEFLIAINIGAGSDNITIEDNHFEMGGGNATEAILFDAESDYSRVINNTIFGDYSTACIFGDTTACVGLLIEGNVLYNGDITIGLNTEPCIELTADTTGVIANNLCICDEASAVVAIVAADCHLFGNKYNETEGSSLTIGKLYVLSKAALNTGGTDDLFLVAGGNILITSFFGEITTLFGGSPGDMTIELDSADNDYDTDFSTTVTVDTAAEGDWIKFDDTIEESVLSFGANTSAAEPILWLCSPGMIEQTLTNTGTGATTWYMTFIPLSDGVTVTVQ